MDHVTYVKDVFNGIEKHDKKDDEKLAVFKNIVSAMKQDDIIEVLYQIIKEGSVFILPNRKMSWADMEDEEDAKRKQSYLAAVQTPAVTKPLQNLAPAIVRQEKCPPPTVRKNWSRTKVRSPKRDFQKNENFKTQTCCWFLNKKCQFDNKCMYLHEVDENKDPIGWTFFNVDNDSGDSGAQRWCCPPGLTNYRYEKSADGIWRTVQ
jgi:hypothetical protein